MKKTILTILTIILFAISGCSTEDTAQEFTPSTLILEVNKTTIKADNSDTATFYIHAYDENSIELTLPEITLYKDGYKINGLSFKTSVNGNHYFTVKSGDITSNTIKVIAGNLSYTKTTQMLGKWTMNFSIIDDYKEYFAFDRIEEDEDIPNEYSFWGRCSQTWSSTLGTFYFNTTAIGHYNPEDNTIFFMSVDDNGDGNCYTFELKNTNSINGKLYLLRDWELSSGYSHSFTGNKTSSSYSISRNNNYRNIETINYLTKIESFDKTNLLNKTNNISKKDNAKFQNLKKLIKLNK